MRHQNAMRTVTVGPITFGRPPFALIAGPCAIESEDGALRIAESLRKLTSRLGIPFVFKASYDKANRTAADSFRGPGLERGLEILARIKARVGVPVLSDVHEVAQVSAAAEVLDILQIPAFLCRQTDLVQAAARSGRVVNVKKGQFLAPEDMRGVIGKVEAAGSERLLLTERGVSFGYHTLVTDFRAMAIMRSFGYPVVFDATHSVQEPGGRGTTSGGRAEFVPMLARCAVAGGIDALFLEVHPDPANAKSDGPNLVPLRRLPALLGQLLRIQEAL
jgi:2-dehydro-3-deoxyphosphooctonate aldolase (KDO 8-P synthase)